MKRKLTIYIHKTFFVVELHDSSLIPTILEVTSHLKSYRYVYNRRIKRMLREEDKSYYAATNGHMTFRFTIAILKDVMITLGRSGIKREEIQILRIVNKNVRPLKLKFDNKKFKLRDYQTTYSTILVEHRNSKPTLLVDLQTGKGKSVIAAYALCKINEATLILVLPRYVEKWLYDISLYTNIKNTDVCNIQGADSIKSLMNTPREEIKYKVFIASITTMNYMISEYEDPYEKYSYPMAPDKFMDHLGVGVLLNDETHQHFHALLKVSLYMNVNQIIGLSATLDSNRYEMKKMYNYMFPKENRISNIIAIDNYIYVKVIEYRLFSLRGIRYMVQGYNHNLYEQCIIRNSMLREDYFDMIYKYVKESYLDRRLPGEKILIFMASVLMCTLFVNYLKEKHPDIDIRRYCEDDPYENIINAEISVSTVISASTAIDIPKLITVINTISMASLQANLQTMGRLRKIEGREVWYYYLYTPMIPNQKQMHKIRRDTIKDRTKLMVYDVYPKILRV